MNAGLTTPDATPMLVLGSSSPFRRELLEKLRLPFVTHAPEIDETRRDGEPPEVLVTRLAEAKARAVAATYPDALIIGSDQVACIDEHILGKPRNRANAVAQLEQASGRTVTFYTSLCLLNAKADRIQVVCEPFRVHFRRLNELQIARYLDAEQPFNCAGSFKSEGYGITLFERLDGADPNALIGLPMIQLVKMLTNEGIELP
jgi:MAF protein